MKNDDNAPATPAESLKVAINSLGEITTKILEDVGLPWVDIDPAVVGDWVMSLSLVKNGLTNTLCWMQEEEVERRCGDDDDEQEEA